MSICTCGVGTSECIRLFFWLGFLWYHGTTGSPSSKRERCKILTIIENLEIAMIFMLIIGRGTKDNKYIGKLGSTPPQVSPSSKENELTSFRKSLPISAQRIEILKLIKEHQVSVRKTLLSSLIRLDEYNLGDVDHNMYMLGFLWFYLKRMPVGLPWQHHGYPT